MCTLSKRLIVLTWCVCLGLFAASSSSQVLGQEEPPPEPGGGVAVPGPATTLCPEPARLAFWSTATPRRSWTAAEANPPGNYDFSGAVSYWMDFVGTGWFTITPDVGEFFGGVIIPNQFTEDRTNLRVIGPGAAIFITEGYFNNNNQFVTSTGEDLPEPALAGQGLDGFPVGLQNLSFTHAPAHREVHIISRFVVRNEIRIPESIVQTKAWLYDYVDNTYVEVNNEDYRNVLEQFVRISALEKDLDWDNPNDWRFISTDGWVKVRFTTVSEVFADGSTHEPSYMLVDEAQIWHLDLEEL